MNKIWYWIAVADLIIRAKFFGDRLRDVDSVDPESKS